MTRKLTKKEKDLLRKISSIGGKSNFERHGIKHMSEIGKKGSEARWSNKNKSKKNDENRIK